MRERNDEVNARGGAIVAIGTGNQRYAQAFVSDEHIPYLVLVDDDAAAAAAATVRTIGWFSLLHPRTWKATRETRKRGYRVHKAGARVRQIGATFVLGPGNQVRYSHLDADSTDHAPLGDVLAALGT